VSEFKIIKDSEQQHYLQSRNQIQIFGGGFGNGKTGTTCVKVLDLAINYPGSRGVFARSTKPKLEDTVKPEFFKWCPVDWIAKMPTEKHNDVILKNGSSVHFRHVRQEGKGRGENASNLLSATYDYAAVDQIDDPAFTHKDLLDLMGRLRGTTKYVGEDKTMPLIGPQWLMITCNPTRNWVFRELVNPLHIYKRNGIVTAKLIYDKHTKRCLVDLFEADTYSNQHNTGENYVRLLEAAYKGSMASRFLKGEWGAYEGLVYPEFDQAIHVLEQHQLREYIVSVINSGEFGIIEGYDHGIVVPSCYLLGIVDKYNNTYIIDGIYEVGVKIADFADRIREIRSSWNIIPSDPIDADPAIFRVGTHKELVGESVSQMYSDEGITMRRGNNNIVAGVAKIASHLMVQKFHYNPVIGEYGSPHLFFSSELEWLANEIGDYYWNRNIAGDNVDKPRDTNDHAMDTLKYMYTTRPRIGRPRIVDRKLPSLLSQWSEDSRPKEHISIRHMH
jgi:hypothetical protein